MLCDRNMPGFEYAKNAEGSEYAWVSSWITPECLNMPEAEPKIIIQAT